MKKKHVGLYDFMISEHYTIHVGCFLGWAPIENSPNYLKTVKNIGL